MVSGHLQVKKGYYYAVLSFYDSKNKRHVKYISTGLPEKGNKRKAEAELVKIRNAFEPPAEIGELCSNIGLRQSPQLMTRKYLKMITGIRKFLSTKREGINLIASINPLK